MSPDSTQIPDSSTNSLEGKAELGGDLLEEVVIPMRQTKYNIDERCHCEGVKPEAISHC